MGLVHERVSSMAPKLSLRAVRIRHGSPPALMQDAQMIEALEAPTRGSSTRHVVLVDDDRNTARHLMDILGHHGYQLAWSPRPASARELLAGRPDLILLDVTDREAFEVCRELRTAGDRTPIILLSDGGGDQACIRGLSVGADDYVSKPFNPQVLLARIEAVLRRSTSQGPAARPSSGLRLDVARKTLNLPHGEVALTLSEYQLLAAMMATPGRCFTREELRATLGDGDPDYTSNRAIDIHVSRLRTKLEADPRHPLHLVTVRGEGYRFDW